MSGVQTVGSSKPRAASRSLIVFLRVVQGLLAFATIAMLFGAVAFGVGWGDALLAEGMDPSLGDVSTVTGRLAFASLTGSVFAATWFVVIRLLIRVVRTIQDGDPFIDANIMRLRWMWILILGGEVLRLVVHALSNIAIGAGSVAATDTGLDLRLTPIFLVLFIASLATAFRHGVELRRDAELTI